MKTKIMIEQRLVITPHLSPKHQQSLDVREWNVINESGDYITIKHQGDTGFLCLNKNRLDAIEILSFKSMGGDCYYITRYSDKPSASFYEDAISRYRDMASEVTA